MAIPSPSHSGLAASGDPLLIHLHVPKCAGASVNYALRQHFGARAISLVPGAQMNPAFRAKTPQQRARRFDCAFGHLTFGAHTLFDRGCVYISATRDPLERVCSHFNFLHTRPDTGQHQFIKERLRDLDALTPRVLDELLAWGGFTNAFCRTYGGRHPPTDRTAFETVRRRVVHNLEEGRLFVSSLPEIEAFLAEIGVPPLPHRNRTDLARFDDFTPASPATLDARTRETLIEHFCRWDYALLDVIERHPASKDGAAFARAAGFAQAQQAA